MTPSSSLNNSTIGRVNRSGSLLKKQQQQQAQNSYNEEGDQLSTLRKQGTNQLRQLALNTSVSNSINSGTTNGESTYRRYENNNNNSGSNFALPLINTHEEKPRLTALSRMSSNSNFKDYMSSPRHSRMIDENSNFSHFANSNWHSNNHPHYPEHSNSIAIKTPKGHKRNKSVDSTDNDTHSLHSVSSSLTASFSKNFLSGFYKNKIRRRKKGQIVLLSEKYWMKDDNCKECFYCAKTFYAFRRKHHCRLCGQIFCSSCAILVSGEKFGYDHKLRFCKICLEHLENDLDSSDDDYSIANETLEVDNEDDTNDLNNMDYSDIVSNNGNVSISQYDNDILEPYSKTTADMASIFGEDDSKFLTESFNPPRLAIPARKTGESLAIESGTTLRPRSHSHHYLTPTKEQASLTSNSNVNSNNNINSNNTHVTPGGNTTSSSNGIHFAPVNHQNVTTPGGRNRLRTSEKFGHHNSKHNLVQSQIFPENKAYWEDANNHNNNNNNNNNNSFDYGTAIKNNRLSKVKSDMALGKISSFFSGSNYENNMNNNSNITNSKSHTSTKRNLSPPPPLNSSDIRHNYSNLNSGINNTNNSNRLYKTLSQKIGNSTSFNNVNNLNKYDTPNSSKRNSYIDENNSINKSSIYISDDEEEDEASMSIFAALNNNTDHSNKKISFDFINNSTTPDQVQPSKLVNSSIFRNRLDPDANKRAEASLQRMRTRRKSRIRPTATQATSTGGYLSSNIFNQGSNSTLKLSSNEASNASHGTDSLTNITDKKPKLDISSSFGEHVSSISETLLYHLRLLIKQTLQDQGVVEDLDIWGEIFENLVISLDRIKVHTKLSDSLDYRQYIKIKRIAGGSIDASKFVDGLIFSKNVPLRTMADDIASPRILLLMFPISYEKAKDRILSLDVLLSQEREYLNSLVSRIMALEPDLVFVSDIVAGEALRLLEDAGITCQFNMKPQVIEKISKFTEADVVNSVDKLMVNVKLGTCDRFCVKTYKYGKILKSFTMLTGCNPANGGTILLRGLDDKGLRKIKNAVEFITYSILSLRFESCFFKDSFININFEDYKKMLLEKKQQVFEGIGSQFLENFNKRLMSTSPGVTFPIPFLLARSRYLENKISNITKIKQDINVYSDEEFDNYCQNKPFLLEIKSKGNLSSIDLRYYTQLILDKKLQILQEKLSNKLRQWNIFYSLGENILGIGSHQSISVLYSMISYSTGTPCIGPVVINIEYYWDNDVTLGQFIENIVTTVDYPCSAGCDGFFIDHYRTYVNGPAKVDVIVERLSSKVPSLKNIILMWSYCKKCKNTTPVLKMDADTWNHSFGKYMELIFWGNKTCSGTIGGCSHDVFKDQIKYFGYNDVVIRLEWSPVEVHSLVTPKQQITWKPHKDILIKFELLAYINDQVEKLYDSIMNRLKRVKLDSSIEELNIEGRNKSLELQKASINEKEIFLKYANEVYMNTPGTENLSLNAVLARLYGKSLTWMNTITDFEKKYLPSEKDITRITSNQLKKLYLESSSKEIDHDKNSSILADIPENEESVKNVKSNNNNDDDENVRELTPSMIQDKETSLASIVTTNDNTFRELSQSPNPLVSDEDMSKSQSLLSLDQLVKNPSANNILSRHLRTMSQGGEENRVGKLVANYDNMYFDNLSKEFEYQRELERKNFRKKYHTLSKPPTKLQDSKPKVEVFQNVMDAVEKTIPNKNNTSNFETASKRALSLPKEDSITKDSSVSPDSPLGDNLYSALDDSIETWESNNNDNNKPVANEENNDNKNDTDSENNDSKNETMDPYKLAKHLDENNPRISNISTTDVKQTQEEKGSLLQLLKNFWADRSSALWEPLHSPILPTEHIFDNNLVIIREDEPSSIIAFCLNSNEYYKKMEQTYVDYAAQIKLQLSEQDLADANGENGGTSQIERLMENSTLIEAVMNKPTPIHLRYQVEDENVLMSCKIFFADQFDALRRASGCCLENATDFIQSLSRCVKWDSSGGKSGSVFLKTLDDRFVLKELSHSEVDTFVQFAPNYFKYMSEAMYQKLPTVIAKIVGFFQIQFKNATTGKSVKFDCIITENLFYGKKNVRIFDLKGSMRNRHVEKTGKENEVLLDENMVEYIYESPIFVREYDKKLLRASVWNDTLFLSKMNVMDYSLVIGIDNNNHKLIVGIIDCIRTFTWDKKLESWVKEKGLVGGGTKEPTVVTPKQYKNRFREAMERYILMVPDPWSRQDNKQVSN
ncbi:hypothetical protein ACO0SA_003084 [Hanseniaspora valbyensis]